MDRRQFLGTSAVMGCSAAASPLFTPMAFAALPTDHRIIVILLRGAMDGLDVVQPYGDAEMPALRPNYAFGPGAGHIYLNDMFALNKALSDLSPLWDAGHLSFAHAVSTPYRDKRSHFDGQDLLEAGTGPRLPLPANQSGWLNRLIQQFPNITSETAYVVGTNNGLILSGEADSSSWNPSSNLTLKGHGLELLRSVCARDKLFAYSLERAVAISQEAGGVITEKQAAVAHARFAANRLLGQSRIASFSIGGWDTHVNQASGIAGSLSNLSAALLALRNDLASVWDTTTVFALTEFGRTARINGSNGTDHGTGGVALMAGGTLKGKTVYGQWPGLNNLYVNRDLMPTTDVRVYPAWVMHDLLGISRQAIENVVFPGLDMGQNPGITA